MDQDGSLRLLLGSIRYVFIVLIPTFVCGCNPAPDNYWGELPWTQQAAFQLANSGAKPLEAQQLRGLLGQPVMRAPFEQFVAELAVSPGGTRQTDENRLAVIHQLQRDCLSSVSVVSRRDEGNPPPLRECEFWVYDPQHPFSRVAPEGRPAAIFFVHDGTVWGSTDLTLWNGK